jgi:hypothetical protein
MKRPGSVINAWYPYRIGFIRRDVIGRQVGVSMVPSPGKFL